MPCTVIGLIKGVKGDKGAKGDKGDKGDKGEQGIQGPPGQNGADGTTDTPSQVLTKIKNVDGTGSGLDSDLLDGYDSTYFAKAEELEDLSHVEYNSLHSAFKLYKNMQVVTFHVIEWASTSFTVLRNEYARVSSIQIPVGFRPPETVYMSDIVSNQHVIVGADGSVYVWVGSDVPAGTKFHGNISWVTNE